MEDRSEDRHKTRGRSFQLVTGLNKPGIPESFGVGLRISTVWIQGTFSRRHDIIGVKVNDLALALIAIPGLKSGLCPGN